MASFEFENSLDKKWQIPLCETFDVIFHLYKRRSSRLVWLVLLLYYALMKLLYYCITVLILIPPPKKVMFCPASVCLSVTFEHPTQAIEIFCNVSMPLGTLAICWHPGKTLRRSSNGNHSVGGVKHKRGSQI